MADKAPPLPPGWTEHTAPTGHKYYYNASLKKSTYKRPTEAAPQQTPPTVPSISADKPTTQDTAPITQNENVMQLTEWSSEMKAEPDYTEERRTARLETDDMWKKLEDRPRKKYFPFSFCNTLTKNRMEIPGAEPWVQVTTKWHRTFYHNPVTNESFWKIPADIRDVVEQMLLETAREEAARLNQTPRHRKMNTQMKRIQLI